MNLRWVIFWNITNEFHFLSLSSLEGPKLSQVTINEEHLPHQPKQIKVKQKHDLLNKMFVAYHGWPGPIIPMPRRTSFQDETHANDKGSRPSISNLRTSIFSRFRRSSTQESTPRGCREFSRKKSLPPNEERTRRFSQASTITPDPTGDNVAPPPYYQPKGCRDYDRSFSVASSISSSTSSDTSSDAPPLPFLQPNNSSGNPFDTTLVLTKDKDGESRLMPLGSLHYKRSSVNSGRGKKIAGNPMCFCKEHRGSGCVPLWNCPNIVVSP